MPQARDWIERIHTRMLGRYGSGWVNLYRGVEREMVIADWCEALNGFGAETIRHALECLPDDHPPNAAQFARLCMRGPQSQAPALPWPQADPAMVATVLAGIKPPPQRALKQWARDLERREMAGDRLTAAQRTMWRAARGHEVLNRARDGQDIPETEITEALRMTGDAR